MALKILQLELLFLQNLTIFATCPFGLTFSTVCKGQMQCYKLTFII